MSGRKKKNDSFNECISIRVTKNQKEILVNNKWIADEIKDLVRKHINLYIMKR